MKDERVDKITNIASSSIDESRVQHLFTLARKLIEQTPQPDRARYSLLRFYCDWTMHSEIDRSKEGARIISRIHDIILKHLKHPRRPALDQELGVALSFDKVRDQLNELILNSGGDQIVFSEAKWSEIVPILVEIISHCPLKIGNHSWLSKILKALQAKPLKGDSIVDEISIRKGSKAIVDPSASKDELIYYLVITTTDTTKLVVPLVK